MKLYFYILKTPYNAKSYVHCDECEVEEKPKTYVPVGKFPREICRSYINKSEIGHILGCYKDRIILTEKDNQFVKNMFSDSIKKAINSRYEEIGKLTEKLHAVEELED